MNKKSFILFVALLIFWLVISEVIDLQHIIIGIFLALFTAWFWRNLNPRLPSILTPKGLIVFSRCSLMLVGYIIKSNIDVAKTLLFSDLSQDSIFLELEPKLESNWGRVFLATCITITPGTVTVDINPENNIFTIHALTQETGVSLYYWSIINEIRQLETLVQRRETYAMDIGGIHDTNPVDPIKGSSGSNSN